LNKHGIKEIRLREIYTAESLLPKPCHFAVEIVI